MTADQRASLWRYWCSQVDRLEQDLADAVRQRTAAAKHMDNKS
jgi:hypothetical protein